MNPAYRLYTQFLPAPNQNPGPGPGADGQLPRRGRARSDAQPPLGRTRRFQPLAVGSLLLPRRGQLLHRRRRRLDVREPAVAGSPLGLAAAEELVLHRQLDACVRRRHGASMCRRPRTGSSTPNGASGMKRYTPTEFGMPQYVNDFCSARQGGCQMPAVNIAGYQGFGGNVGLYPEVLNIQGQVNVTHVRDAHTLRFGTDNRSHGRNDLEPRQHVRRGELHQPVHARRRRHDGLPGRQPRALVGRVHAGRSAVVLDRRFRGAEAPLAVSIRSTARTRGALAGT